MSRFLSRKFILALLVLGVATWLLIGSDISEGTYRDLVLATVGAYIAGNVLQKKSEAKAP